MFIQILCLMAGYGACQCRVYNELQVQVTTSYTIHKIWPVKFGNQKDLFESPTTIKSITSMRIMLNTVYWPAQLGHSQGLVVL